MAAGALSAGDPFAEWDKDGDGFLTREEFPDKFGDRMFDRIDADGDGKISRKEDDDYRARRRRGGRGRAELPPGTRVERDLVYARVGERDLVLDLYRPEKADGPLPIVLWVHGGGWRGGSKDSPGRALPLVGHWR
jgi:acetyl esterase/lipase